jgi:hypothetical protein
MSIDIWQVDYRIDHITNDPGHIKTTYGTALVDVPNWVTDEDSYYSDEHRIYQEHDDDGQGIGCYTMDDSYDEDNSPLTAYLREQLHTLRPDAILEGYQHVNDEDVETVKRNILRAYEEALIRFRRRARA